MSFSTFESFPENARLWVYAADRSLTADEQDAIQQSLANFFDQWKSHGRVVEGASTFVENRFLLVAGYVPDNNISGCGIDSSVNTVDTVAKRFNVNWLSALHVFFRSPDGDVQAVKRPEFRQLVKEGVVDQTTPVFDISLETIGDLRNKGFGQPAAESWHSQVFHIPATT